MTTCPVGRGSLQRGLSDAMNAGVLCLQLGLRLINANRYAASESVVNELE